MTVSSVNFTFPKDVAVRQQWLREIRRETFTPSGTSVICSDHFEESCYVATAQLRRKLQTYKGSKRTEASEANQCD